MIMSENYRSGTKRWERREALGPVAAKSYFNPDYG
jgi:hypothetical protein